MLSTIFAAFWFFMPAGYANVMPIIAAKTPFLKKYDMPIDCGYKIGDKRIFGDHKTWRGLIFSFIFTVPVLYLQNYLYQNSEFFNEISYVDYTQQNLILLSFLFVFGALGGDAIKSFFKRRSNVKPGESWFPFDQIDYVIGGLLAVSLVIDLTLNQYVGIFFLFFILHPTSTIIGYYLGLKDKPL